MCLNEIGRDHRFISYRKMESEATLNFNSLLDHISSAHISSLNLLTCLTCICNIAQQRPQFMQRVVGMNFEICCIHFVYFVRDLSSVTSHFKIS